MLPFDPRGLQLALAELDELKARLDARAALVIAWEGQLGRDLEAAAIHASVSMEGVPVTVEEVRRILAGDRPLTVSSGDAELVRGYREAMTYVQGRADDPVFEWSPELLKALHHRVLAGRRGAGRYGEGRFLVHDVTNELIYTPPQEGVARLIADVCRRMNEWDAHAALRAAWVHIAIAAVHPFKDGNGRTARILASLAMYRGDFKRPEFCSLEEWWGNHKDSYYKAFECLGPAFNPDVDVTSFIRAHVEGQRSQVRALALREETNRQIWTALTRVCEHAGLPDRAAFAIWDAYNGRDVVRPYYRAVTDVSDTSATSDFNGLRAAGLLIARGRTRGRKYSAGPQLFRRIADELGIQNPDRADRAVIVREITERLGQTQKSFASVPALSVATGSALFPDLAPPLAVTEWPKKVTGKDEAGATRTTP